MSLIKILKDFITNIENENSNDEKSHICRLNYILDEYYQQKFEYDSDSDSCSDSNTECNCFNNNNILDDIVNDLRGNIDREKNIIILPDLSDLQSYSSNIIRTWIELDKKEEIEYQMVFNACKKNYEDEYIIYLIEIGFVPSILDTFVFAYFQRFELLQYYFNKNLQFHKYTANEIICQGRLDILDWLFQNDLVESESEQDLIETAIRYNDIFIIDYLMKYYDIEYIYNIYENLSHELSKNKINNVMLAWLWGNGMKWTKGDAEKFNNNFMMSFY
jgi:hypothetical protein